MALVQNVSGRMYPVYLACRRDATYAARRSCVWYASRQKAVDRLLADALLVLNGVRPRRGEAGRAFGDLLGFGGWKMLAERYCVNMCCCFFACWFFCVLFEFESSSRDPLSPFRKPLTCANSASGRRVW